MKYIKKVFENAFQLQILSKYTSLARFFVAVHTRHDGILQQG